MIRLLGFQPLDAADQEEVAVIFTASHALRPVGKAFDELISETGVTAHEHYVEEVRARWGDLVGPDEPERARAILIDLIEQNVERIEGILAEHDEHAAEHAERTINRLGVDRRPEGKLTREYGLRCHNVLFRTSETYRKHQAKRLNGKMQDERGTMTDDEWAARPVLRAGDRMVATMDGQPDAPQVAGRALRPVRGVLGGPADSTPSPEPAELPGSGAGEAGRTLVEEATGTVATAAATADCGKSGPGTGAKFTNEANFSEHAGITKTHKNKAISAEFGVEPGLDKMKTKPIRARGPRGAGAPGFQSQLSSLVSQVSNLESLISSLNSQVPDLEPEDAGPVKSNTDSRDANLGLREGGLAGANGVRRDGRHPGTPSPSESAALSESGAGLTGRTLVETLDEATGTVAAAAATADCGKSGPGTGAKITSEPKFSEHAGIAKTHKNKGISPDFGVEPGLDKMETKPIRARGPRGAGTTPSPSPGGRAEGFAHARPRLTAAAARGARAAGKAIYKRARREASRRFRLKAGLQQDHAQQNWRRASRLRWSPAFRRRVKRDFWPGSNAGNSAGWLGSATGGRRPRAEAFAGGLPAAPARPQPPTVCHLPSFDSEPRPIVTDPTPAVG